MVSPKVLIFSLNSANDNTSSSSSGLSTSISVATGASPSPDMLGYVRYSRKSDEQTAACMDGVLLTRGDEGGSTVGAL